MIDECIEFCFYPKNKGFTLIELLVAVAISSLVLLVIGNFFISTNRTNTIQEKVAGTQQGIRGVMELISRDVRMAGLNPAGTAGNAGFVDNGNTDDAFDTDANSIAFAYDYFDDAGNPNSDGDCSDTREYICYSYDATNQRIMYRWSNDGGASWQAGAITENGTIDSVTFTYLLDDDSTVSDPSASGDLGDIRSVTMQICGKITGAYSDEFTETYCFSNTIRPRNL